MNLLRSSKCSIDVTLGRYNSVLRGFVGRVMASGTENRIGDASSHSELVCCTRFRTNTLGKGINLSLLPPPVITG